MAFGTVTPSSGARTFLIAPEGNAVRQSFPTPDPSTRHSAACLHGSNRAACFVHLPPPSGDLAWVRAAHTALIVQKRSRGERIPPLSRPPLTSRGGPSRGGGGGLRPPRPVLPESPLHTPSNTTTHNTSQPVSEELSPPEQVT